MPRFRVMIVESEEDPRRQLHGLISLDPEFEVIPECVDGDEAVDSLKKTRPDILFVDAESDQVDGFAVARSAEDRLPLVIMTSHRREDAARAFEARVFDYLMKPLDEIRVRDTLSRARADLCVDGAAEPESRLFRLMEDFLRVRRPPDRIAIRQNGRVVFVRIGEIDWIEAANNYALLHCGGETHVIRETLNELEARLDASRFIRVHRSTIVNLDRIKELQPWFRGDYRVILLDGTELTLTKSHREKLNSQCLLGPMAR